MKNQPNTDWFYSFYSMNDFQLENWPKPLLKDPIVNIFIAGKPVPKDRPRFNSNTSSVYTTQETKKAEEDIGWMVKSKLKGRGSSVGWMSVRLAFYVVDGRKSGDIDNLCKLVLDACNKIIWQDDKQVIELCARVIRGTKEGTHLIASLLD